MLVQRLIFNAKPGAMPKLAELLQAERARTGRAYRIYTSHIGEHDRIAIEFDWEGLAELEQFWAQWMASPEGISFMQEFDAQRERGAINEIWVLVE